MSDTMLDFWASHVQGWLALARTANAHVVRYEDLVDDFDNSVSKIAKFLGSPCTAAKKPRSGAFVTAGPVKRNFADAGDWSGRAHDRIDRIYPGLLETLGYAGKNSGKALGRNVGVAGPTAAPER